MDVAVVGAGRVGTAMAIALRGSGHRLVGVSGRDATAERAARYLPGVPVLTAPDAARLADAVIVAVPDDAIAEVITSLAAASVFSPGDLAIHVSGATTLDALDPAAAEGARRLSIHPLQTFPSVERAIDRLPGSAMAVTADDGDVRALGMSLARDMGGEPFGIDDADRGLYHAAAVFASNYVVTVSALAASLFEAAGVPDPLSAMAPLQRATVENVASMGPAGALTGPAVRGDRSSIERNLRALATVRPEIVPTYVELARAAVRVGVDSGRLDASAATAVLEVLDPWT